MRPTAPAARALLEGLRARALRVAVAESCTGGEVLAALTAPAGASATVWGGAVVYTTEAKVALAGVAAEQVASEGVVSEAVAGLLATGIRARAGVDLGLAVTGWAGPEGEGPDPVGTVVLGAAGPGGLRTRRLSLEGERAAVRRAAVLALLEAALAWLPSLCPIAAAEVPSAPEGRR